MPHLPASACRSLPHGLPLAPAPTNPQSSSATTHVVLVVNTSNPDVVAKAFSNGTMLANLIKPTGVNIVPTTVEVRTHPAFMFSEGRCVDRMAGEAQ